ncbi:MAG TPA: hypothetical protein VEP90_26430, partial [Methylomirabilota bacterium]|nr:hypothetical protein [Methylomirabilota bacterium]
MVDSHWAFIAANPLNANPASIRMYADFLPVMCVSSPSFSYCLDQHGLRVCVMGKQYTTFWLDNLSYTKPSPR